ncbi:MAG: ABC transporter substrate-binding protein [Amaricoccus sp.]|nr:ABC transporter substrate-binding protein [Amaricoccus sp.]
MAGPRRANGAGRLGVALALALAAAPAAAAPARVVSTNLCTDQLALLLAAPGQLVSVSAVSHDPVASAMAAEAAAYPVNHGRAEEVFLLAPDLVVAGESDPPATLAMLRRLGLRVEVFPIEADFDDVRANVRRMGALIGQEARAEALVDGLDAALAAPPAGPRPRAAILYANAWTSGAGTLADEILRAAGLDNVAADRGIVGMGALPLEVLAAEAPDLLVLGQDYGTPALAQETLAHPVVGALGATRAAVADNLWVCGTPMLARAVAALRAARPAP